MKNHICFRRLSSFIFCLILFVSWLTAVCAQENANTGQFIEKPSARSDNGSFVIDDVQFPASGNAGNERASAEAGSLKPAGTNSVRANPASQASSAGAAAKPAVKLYGRIEEIMSTPGATLPLKLQAQSPKMDNSGQQLTASAKTNQLTGRVASFPMDWRGQWSGPLKVWTSVFDKIKWEFDAKEAAKEQALMRPGTQGQVTFNFSVNNAGKVRLEPAKVVFTAMMSGKEAQEVLQRQLGGQGAALAEMMQGLGGAGSMLGGIPYMYALHLGDLASGVGVTGNQLSGKVLRNDIRELATGVLEQVIVTHDTDRNPDTGKVRQSYSESVLRFTRITANQLYVQAASLNYRNDGRFESKIVLYGSVYRNNNASPPAGQLNGINLFEQGGGMQQLMQQMQQLQQLAQ